MNAIFVFIAIFAGIVFAIQPAVNSSVARALNHPIQASLISFFVGTVILAVVHLALGLKVPPTERLLTVPWWLYLSGGAIGAFVVTVALLIQPQVGAGVWISGYVFGQLAISILLDNYGWLNLPVHPFNWMRGLGAFLLVIGAILIANY